MRNSHGCLESQEQDVAQQQRRLECSRSLQSAICPNFPPGGTQETLGYFLRLTVSLVILGLGLEPFSFSFVLLEAKSPVADQAGLELAI